MQKLQDKPAINNAKRKWGISPVAVISGAVAGATAGVGTAYYAVQDYLYDIIDKKGWFNEVQKRTHGKLAEALENDAVSYGYGGEEMIFEESQAIKAEYRAACDAIIADNGIKTLTDKFNMLEKNQKIAAVAFTAGAAIAVGALVYMGINRVMQARRDATPAR